MIKHTILVTLLLIQHLFAITPTETMNKFMNLAQKNNHNEAWKFITKFETSHKEATEALNKGVQGFIKEISKGGWKFDVIEEKIEGDFAVVILAVSHSKFADRSDIDPTYLIKQNGEWKVFPQVTKWQITDLVEKNELKTLEKLEAWYKMREAKLEKPIIPENKSQ